uniref:TLDc domain-containing protein n=1 Tax=Chromera velia CCMP2878 TaxID=1169474 RepID=A0A0G4I0J2_9ALVE|eukprot:Cvel_1629.t1-p1 / transcript=Cvel_1629.t1 / gene=Cvel_1629 / organism=Chromera_velia_CCMP2878 / gene_product=hypothetical protein / transcript_product=hypothetical protein / location=Cvel_scaffold58:78522-79106(+) / protein_length=195 / sequence_SO=supercontig / SO=protein_coding / is_pseudo=false
MQQIQKVLDALAKDAVEGESRLAQIKETVEGQAKAFNDKMRQCGIRAAPNFFKDSPILANIKSADQVAFLSEWYPGHWTLVYRGTRDGMSGSGSAFHAKADKKGPTVTIIKSGDDVFGGYTKVSWEGTGGKWVSDDTASLFLLNSSQGINPTQFPVKQDKAGNAVYHHSSHGPAFGSDIRCIWNGVGFCENVGLA